MKVTNQIVLTEGNITDHYPCDVDWETGVLETNGGIENVVEYKGERYIVVSDWTQVCAMFPNAEAETIDWQL